MKVRRFSTVLGVAVCLGFMTTGSQAGAGAPEEREDASRHGEDRDGRGDRHRQLLITSAFADLDAELLLIYGRNLSSGRPPRVRLGAIELEVEQPFSREEITAVLPADIAPGSYLLKVWRGRGEQRVDYFDVAVGLAEAVEGPPGPTGPQGPAGLSCWDLDGDRSCDLATEDVNGDQACTAADCVGPPGPPGSVIQQNKTVVYQLGSGETPPCSAQYGLVGGGCTCITPDGLTVSPISYSGPNYIIGGDRWTCGCENPQHLASIVAYCIRSQ